MLYMKRYQQNYKESCNPKRKLKAPNYDKN